MTPEDRLDRIEERLSLITDSLALLYPMVLASLRSGDKRNPHIPRHNRDTPLSLNIESLQRLRESNSSLWSLDGWGLWCDAPVWADWCSKSSEGLWFFFEREPLIPFAASDYAGADQDTARNRSCPIGKRGYTGCLYHRLQGKIA